jgi:hypothetical protein
MKSLDTRFLNGVQSKGLPAWAIMACVPENPESSEFVEYVTTIAAARRGITPARLKVLAETAHIDILRPSKGSAPASDTVLFATLVCEAIREIVAFFPYVSDILDENSGGTWSSRNMKPYEFFSNALRVAGGGDCEDKAREACEIFRGIIRMKFKQTQTVAAGAWAVARCYVPMLVLGEVEARAVTEYDKVRRTLFAHFFGTM